MTSESEQERPKERPAIPGLPPVPAVVAKGTYTDIVRIDAPDSAAQGSRVDVTVRVKNIDPTFYHWVACIAIVNGLRFIDQDTFLGPEETHSYSGAFLMAGGDVTITAYSYYSYYGEWIPDDEDEEDVALAEVFKGTINRKELEYNETRGNIPVY